MPSTPDFQPNQVWSGATAANAEEELTTPSGQTCRARKMSIESMIEAGMLAEADALTAMVTKHIRKVRGAKGKADSNEVNTTSLMRDVEAVKALITLMDRAIPQIIVSPVVKLHYTEDRVGKTTVTKLISEEKREEIRAENPGQLIVFTDQIGFEDKMFLFDWSAGGLATMLQFRQ